MVLLTGTNDLVFGRPLDRPIGLLDTMIGQLRTARVVPFVRTLPAYTVADANVIDFNARVRQLCERNSVLLIDFHACVAQQGVFAAGLSDDGIHPNRKGSRLMGRVAVPILRAALALASS